MKSLIAEPKQNIAWQKYCKGYIRWRKKKGGKLGEKIKKIKESCR